MRSANFTIERQLGGHYYNVPKEIYERLHKEAEAIQRGATEPTELTPKDINAAPDECGPVEPDYHTDMSIDIQPQVHASLLSFSPITQDTEPEGEFLRRIDSTVDAFTALFERIEEDAAVAKGLGGDEVGIIELELNNQEWELLYIHLSYTHGSNRSFKMGEFSHDYHTRCGKVRLYRKKEQ